MFGLLTNGRGQSSGPAAPTSEDAMTAPVTTGRAAPGPATRATRAAVVLAAGHDAASRELLARPLGDATVVELAVATVRKVVDPGRVVVVVSPDDPTVRELLGAGTDGPVLVAYADTPLLRSESLLGLLTRHTLTGADLSLLSAVVDDPQP